MPFSLKNVEATSERMAITLFLDMIHKEIDVYLDDMMKKSSLREGHFGASEEFSERVNE